MAQWQVYLVASKQWVDVPACTAVLMVVAGGVMAGRVRLAGGKD